IIQKLCSLKIQILQIVTLSQQARDPTVSKSLTLTLQREFPQRKVSFRKSTQCLIRYTRTRQIKTSQILQTHQCINELQCHIATSNFLISLKADNQRSQSGSLADRIGKANLTFLTSREGFKSNNLF
ncbi:hypothetical protein PIB30_110621, partial [Stylosanthes scabra]|nr:hypothetical protein [Stylosanthes scabra]